MNRVESHWLKLAAPLFLFAVSMGFLEAIVVVYLRELFYPEGFAFPLKQMPRQLIVTEMARELCTLLMLVSVAYITGKTLLRRLAAFLFLFGTWDIFYYIALYVFLRWPESLFTWDILFLIPVAWTAPVLAPLICSLVMIAISLLMEGVRVKRQSNTPGTMALLLFFTGSVIIIISFVYDFGSIILKGNFLSHFFSLPQNEQFIKEVHDYVPDRFQWEIFGTGLFIILTGIIPLLKTK